MKSGLTLKYCEDEGFFLYLIALYKNPNLSDSIKTYITEHDMAYKDLYSHEDVQALIELIPSEDQDNPDWQLHCAIMRRVEKGTHKELRPLYEAILRTTNPYWIDFRQDALDAIEDINQPPWD